jgi:hypothetical protein
MASSELYVRKVVNQVQVPSGQGQAPAPHVTNDIVPSYQPHSGERSQYLRDIIMGVNDGLVSMFLLLVGVRSEACPFTEQSISKF